MSETKNITLNGSPHPLKAGVSVERLLHDLRLEGKPVVVELDEQPVFPRDFPLTVVNPGARVEIVALAAGG